MYVHGVEFERFLCLYVDITHVLARFARAARAPRARNGAFGAGSVLGSLHTGRPKIPQTPLETNFLGPPRYCLRKRAPYLLGGWGVETP